MWVRILVFQLLSLGILDIVGCVRAFEMNALGSLLNSLAVFSQMSSNTFHASWSESIIDAAMTKSLAFEALGWVCCFIS